MDCRKRLGITNEPTGHVYLENGIAQFIAYEGNERVVISQLAYKPYWWEKMLKEKKCSL